MASMRRMATSRQYTDVTTAPEALDAAQEPTLADIRAAAERLRGVIQRTPLLPFRGDSFIKAESLQPTGSFKIRGAYNAMSRLSADERARGVVTHSSGNHAQALARAGRLLGVRVVVVMPNNAPSIKVEGVRADGAEIEFVGPLNPERVARAHEIAEHDGLVLIPSANNVDVVTGQGTAGIEIVEQLIEAGVTAPPVVLVPVGLGGLSAGVSLAVTTLLRDAKVFGVEPSVAADTRESLERGERTAWPAEKTSTTIADGLRGEAPSEIPFAIMKRHLAGVIAVEESEIVHAIGVGAREARLVLEPSGATPLAALLSHRGELPPGPIVVVASGGNVDPKRYVEWLASG
jgi:threonine dehydratase